MRCIRHLITGLAVFRSVLVAADVTQWKTEWSTTTCWSTKAAETMWSTEYSTTTCWSTKTPPPVTLYDTISKTVYDTITSSETIYDTITSSKTVYDTITSATTLEVPYTTTSLIEKDFTTTVYSSFAQVVTSVETSVATVTKVLVSTVTVSSLATSIQTSINIVPGKGYTSTVIIQNTETITQACFTPAPKLTGLVVCSSRITNEQGYVPPTPLPSTYLWGCPPGELCKPKQTNCNFEAGVYASTYICAPEDCIVAEKPPPLDQVGGPYGADVNSTCPFFETFDDYPLLAPSLFGLDYNEYAVSTLGISASSCPPAIAPPQTTTTTTPSPVYVPPPSSTTTYSPPLPPPSSSTTQWLPWTKSSSYAPPPSSSTWSSYVPPAPVISSSSWAEWVQSSSTEAYSSGWDGFSATKTWSHGVTPRALEARAAAVTAPAICQKACDGCVLVGGYCAKVYSSLCPPGVSFQVALASCQDCISAFATAQPKQISIVLTDLNQFLDVCSNGPPKTTTASAPAIQVTTTAPKVTTTTVKPPPTTTTTKIKPPPTTTTVKPPPTTTSQSTVSTTSITQPIPLTTSTTSSISLTTSPSSTTPVIISTTSTTPSPPAPPIGVTSTGTLCLVSEFSDGQPQATSCAGGAASPASTTSANTSVSSYNPSNAAQATQRPAAAMVIGVVVVMAMV